MIQADAAHGLTIRFHREATVNRPFIYLSDIAQIQGSDAANIEAYQSAKLIPAPPSGSQIVLDFDTIRNRLRALGLSLSNIEYAGASRIIVKRSATNDLSGTRAFPHSPGEKQNRLIPYQTTQAKRVVQKVICNNLTRQKNLFDIHENEIEVDLDEPTIAVLASSNPADWEIQQWSPPQAGLSHLVLSANPQTMGTERQSIECDIRMPALILTVRHPLSSGQTLEPTDLTWMYSNQTPALSQPDEVIGMQTKRSLRPGMPLQEEDLQKKPYVRPRDIVTVYARQGGITVKRTMRAVKGGGLGEIIPLVSFSGKESVVAKIIGYHKTEVISSPN